MSYFETVKFLEMNGLVVARRSGYGEEEGKRDMSGYKRAAGKILMLMEMFYILTIVVDIQIHTHSTSKTEEI